MKNKKAKPKITEAQALKRVKDMWKVWERMHPFEMAMSKKAVDAALPKSTQRILAKKANSKQNRKALVKFFEQVDSMKI